MSSYKECFTDDECELIFSLSINKTVSVVMENINHEPSLGFSLELDKSDVKKLIEMLQKFETNLE
ncbi:MAG TPA: hypothetical protein PLP23_20845 [Panacibacter sp.]|nr:hypothetical protein [Panacibacter sp.]